MRLKKRELKKIIKTAIKEDRNERKEEIERRMNDKFFTYLPMGVAFAGLVGVIITSMGFVYGDENYLTGGMMLVVLSFFGYISLDNAVGVRKILQTLKNKND
jgi:predicted PurR-regulated permease PerM